MRSLVAAVALLAGLPAGCLSPDGPSADVVATFYPLEFLAREIAGPNHTVSSLVRPGTEPHDYEPTVRDLNALREAKLLVVQGAGFEAWAVRARAQAPQTRIATATQGLPLLASDEGPDPHTWLDPLLYAAMAATVESGLAGAFPAETSQMRERAETLRGRLAQLDGEFAAGLADCGVRAVITAHAAFAYLAARYGFEQVAIQGLSPDAEPTHASLNHVIDEARQRNITVVFFEELASPALAQAIAREIGGETRVLSPIEGIASEAQAAGTDYFTLQRENLANLRYAMRCK